MKKSGLSTVEKVELGNSDSQKSKLSSYSIQNL